MFFNFRRRQKIHLYTICWNEEHMLEFFFRHYDPLVDRYVIYDDGSTDRTLELLHGHPRTEVRSLTRPDGVDSYVMAALHVHETCWQESRGLADWVIITAVDELLYTPDTKSYLAKCTRKGITAIPALGYDMISETFPSPGQDIVATITRGKPLNAMNKLSVFNPNKIDKTNQHGGRHLAEPTGKVRYPDKDILLNLHYRHLSFEHTYQRNLALDQKLGKIDKERRFGIEYALPREEQKARWDSVLKASVENVFASHYDPHREHSPLTERWWRNHLPAK